MPAIPDPPGVDLIPDPLPAEPSSHSLVATKRQNLRRSLPNRIAPPILQAIAPQSKEGVREPPSYRDALEHIYREHWRSAIRSEYSSLMENET